MKGKRIMKIKKLHITLASTLLLISSSTFADTVPFIPSGGATASNVYQPDQRKLISTANQFPYNTIVYIETIGGNGVRYRGVELSLHRMLY